ncbi:histidine phosphatase family protein [Corynebacterium aquilae]|uniref:Phosphoglycerate mutase n=1 Tax=Corynebacterium aquilae DSM 44791 TaxID=1431546 RepID=A0A1L7CIG2_9CORY|nr:histidine phosphatase family protein [Corynebacterium aquilae]APT85647.1 hypothetical protein CAQU_12025 [Corynebacterium aquilae DSM 44791]
MLFTQVLRPGRLILVRHGQTHGNVEGRLDTALPGADLTELGRQQAVEVGQELAGLIGEVGPAAILTSEALRAQHTGELIREGLSQQGVDAPNIEIVPGIKEIAAGDLEGATDRESMDHYISVCFSWLEGRFDAQLPGGETYEGFVARWAPVFEELRAALSPDGAWAGRDVVLVSHGAAIRMIVAAMTVVDPLLMRQSLIRNCGYVVLHPPAEDGQLWFVSEWKRVTQIAGAGTAGG